jgi:hypothetical protein
VLHGDVTYDIIISTGKQIDGVIDMISITAIVEKLFRTSAESELDPWTEMPGRLWVAWDGQVRTEHDTMHQAMYAVESRHGLVTWNVTTHNEEFASWMGPTVHGKRDNGERVASVYMMER